MDSSPRGSSVHGNSPGKNSAVGAMSSSRGSSQARDRTHASHIAGGFFTREPQEYRSGYPIPTPEDVPDPVVKPGCPATDGFFTSWATRVAWQSYKAILGSTSPKTLSPRWDSAPVPVYRVKPVNLKGNQSWLFIGRTDAEVEGPILWPPDAKNGFIGKDSDAGQDWRQEEKGTTEDVMVAWHHRLDGCEL